MGDKEISELIDLLYPHFLKRLKSESIYKNCIKSKKPETFVSGFVRFGKVAIPPQESAAEGPPPERSGFTRREA